MTMFQSAKTALKDEIMSLRWPLRVVFFVLFVLVAGDDIESRVAPVLTDMQLLHADISMHPTEGKRLCFDYASRKNRAGIGTGYVAQVYLNDEKFPVIRGVTHRDGTPFGGKRANSPAGEYVIDYCITVGHVPDDFSRIGVRTRIEWEVPGRPWLLRQTFWTDYRPENAADK